MCCQQTEGTINQASTHCSLNIRSEQEHVLTTLQVLCPGMDAFPVPFCLSAFVKIRLVTNKVVSNSHVAKPQCQKTNCFLLML